MYIQSIDNDDFTRHMQANNENSLRTIKPSPIVSERSERDNGDLMKNDSIILTAKQRAEGNISQLSLNKSI